MALLVLAKVEYRVKIIQFHETPQSGLDMTTHKWFRANTFQRES